MSGSKIDEDILWMLIIVDFSYVYLLKTSEHLN